MEVHRDEFVSLEALDVGECIVGLAFVKVRVNSSIQANLGTKPTRRMWRTRSQTFDILQDGLTRSMDRRSKSVL